MASSVMSIREGWGTKTVLDNAAPPIPDDPRVPRLDDADPSQSKELGGAAPAVGSGAER